MFNISEINFNNNVKLTISHYYQWLESNWHDIEGLNSTDSTNNKELLAESLFLCFQGFYFYFKQHNDNYATISRDYSLWKDDFQNNLKGKPHLGNLEYCEDSDHAQKIKVKLDSIWTDLQGHDGKLNYRNNPNIQKKNSSSFSERCENLHENLYHNYDLNRDSMKHNIAILVPAPA